MVAFEICARFLVAGFLAWSLLSSFFSPSSGGFKGGMAFALIACGFGIIMMRHGMPEDAGLMGLAGVMILLPAMAALAWGKGPGQRTAPAGYLGAACAAGFFVGQGAISVALILSLLVLVMHLCLGNGMASPVSSEALTVLRVKAQEIRGFVERLEGVFDRLQIQPSKIAIDSSSRDKEMHITVHFALPPAYEKEKLLTAVREVEGVIQLALE